MRGILSGWGAALAGVALAGCAAAPPPMAAGAAGPAPAYVAYVVSESADQASRVEFGPGGARVADRRTIGTNPVEVEGPHGVAVSPDGRFYYVTVAHGTPYGYLLKISTETGEVAGQTTLGLFPATVDVTPDGEYAFVSNFNFHGDPVPSSISKVHLPTMKEVARTETCVMPHGSRVNAAGTKHYSVCMMDQVLVEIDVASGRVSRRFSLAPGREGITSGGGGSEHSAMGHGAQGAGQVCAPTWAHPGADGSFVYVACNRGGYVLEVDTRSWKVARRFTTGEAPYNLATTPDGRLLLVTLKNRKAPATEVIELQSGRTLARVPATAVLPHGVAVTPDSRYAFVSAEGVGAEPGKVDVIDLRSLERVASTAVGQQAGGIALLPAGRAR
jgi:DNA-binding beta-propeller fold protein YncE